MDLSKKLSIHLKFHNPLISIVIPTFNRVAVLKEALDAISRQTLKEFDVIVVDNGPSTDNTSEIVKSFTENDSRFIYTSTTEKGDFVARNIGCKQANADIIFTTDDDWEMTDTGMLEYIVKIFSDDPLVGAIGISEYYPDGRAKGKRVPCDTDPITWKDILKETTFYPPGMMNRWGMIGNKFHYFEMGQKYSVEHLRSSALAFRRTLFDKVGGFPLCYAIDGNAFRSETEFCLKIYKTGFKVIYSTELQGLHKAYPKQAGSFSREKDGRYFYVTGRNNTLLFLRNYWSLMTAPVFFLWDILIGNSTQPGILRFFTTHRNLLRKRFSDGSSPMTKSISGKWRGFIDYYRGAHRLRCNRLR
jgi:glycosyltransferase involved in cell wall biosynthesis